MYTTQRLEAQAQQDPKMTVIASPEPKFVASSEEQQLAHHILDLTKCRNAGALSADAATDIFKRSGLSYSLLRDIWDIADKNKSGDLSTDELTVAIRLMGWVQMGEGLNDGLLAKSGPLPTLTGITDVIRRQTPSQAQQFPPVNQDDIRHYKRVFLRAGPVDGLLDGDKVMDSFMTSDLTYDLLSQVKKVIDKLDRGSLNFCEFSLGMYLIQCIQSCLITSVPTSIPSELLNQFPDLQPGDLEPHPLQPRLLQGQSSPSLHASFSRTSPPLFGTNTPLQNLNERHESSGSEILPHERLESDERFHELDVDHKGYVDGDPVGRFFMSFGLPSEDVAQIWNLVNVNNDNRLTSDSFAIALHLIRQKLAGREIPASLPPARRVISKRLSVSPTSPTLLASIKNKPPPPIPPKRDRTLSIRGGNAGAAITNIPTASTPSKYSAPVSPPSSPVPTPRSHSRMSLSVPSMSSMYLPTLSKPLHQPADVLSPFEDPAGLSSSYPPSRHDTSPTLPQPQPQPGPQPEPQPQPPDNPNLEALEELKKETTRLSLQVESLLNQLTAQNRIRDLNEKLRNENDTLKSELRDMERTVSEVLSANDLNGSQDEYIEQISRLTGELANKESQFENSERMLAVVTQDGKELRVSLRESQQATVKAKSEVEDLKQSISSQTEEIAELKSRLSDMGKAMSEPSSTTNNREMRVLIRDVTKENGALKTQVREMQHSMEQLLLSTKFHARFDEVDRENKQLKQHVRELELIAAQMQFSPHSHPSESSRSVESLTRENEELKSQLKDGQRSYAQFRSTSETKTVELQQRIDSLTHENNRLKIDSTPRRAREDNSVPPPAYDDSFVIPP